MIYVVGIPKSGTSYATTLIESLGYPSVVGRHAYQLRSDGSPYDIRESYVVNMMNNKLLYFDLYLGRNSMDTMEIKEYLKSIPENSVIKDTRFVELLEDWLTIQPGKVVLVHRNQEDTCKSFRRSEWCMSKIVNTVEETVAYLNAKLQNINSLDYIKFNYDEFKNDSVGAKAYLKGNL